VAILSGGGSGHEPAHAGFVGEGFLDAAVCGNVFASPNVAQIRRGIHHVTGEKGALLVVKNYTGDALHFGLAAEQHKSAGLPGDVRVVMVGDDVAVGREQGAIVGRRGLAGTILVYKIAAALSSTGASLDSVESIAKYISTRLATLGVGLEHCHVPGTRSSEAHLGPEEVELGMGIHNEPGTSRISLPTVSKLIDTMLSKITDTTDPDRSFVPFNGKGDEVVLMVNCLGGISELEMGGITQEAISWLKEKNIKVKRVFSGTYMTSLNMPGFSLTLLLLPKEGEEYGTEEILKLLDAPANAPGWRWTSGKEPGEMSEKEIHVEVKKGEEVIVAREYRFDFSTWHLEEFLAAIIRACKSLIEAEPELTKQDQIAGDGDAGLTLEAGAKGVLKAIEEGKLKGENVVEDIGVIAEVVEEEMGGTSGALYSVNINHPFRIFFAGLGTSLRSSKTTTTSPTLWAQAAEEALKTLYKYTRARPPSRTLVDPLETFITSLSTSSLSKAAEAALESAEKTKELVAKAGRGAYVNQEELKKRMVPDPGAWGVWRIVDGLRGYQV
ncbi:hypothetical protein TREMEDRAFT_32898, partial [Tremella mesenterica DSM 1558]|uniref:uncharacterized protein n=1 Tax=Tremella mesenterica (strain ATCC 24925 / CBS 8224 / DSM 1558 / NBRC 9311 / NRRL Y-6157 / RJB 2259-6 / UBC 559-6) TaxID=578456 RepID=UPI0003F4A2CC